jgi:hypothetical protein
MLIVILDVKNYFRCEPMMRLTSDIFRVIPTYNFLKSKGTMEIDRAGIKTCETLQHVLLHT